MELLEHAGRDVLAAARASLRNQSTLSYIATQNFSPFASRVLLPPGRMRDHIV